MAERYGREDFGRILNEARQAHNLSIRDAARIAGVPFATMQGWLSGRHIPVPASRANCMRLLEALGLGDAFEPNFWNRETGLSRSLRKATDAPYLGLRPFGTADAALFHGRDHEVRKLAEVVKAALPHGIIAVIGASGSGKSSLLAAGLVAGDCVDGELQGHSARLLAVQDLVAVDSEVEIVVLDQFEDILREPDDIRLGRLEAVSRLAERALVVIALRSDAFAAASAEPSLTRALAHPFLVSPLSRAELEAVITGPASAVGVRVEGDLVKLLLDELAPGSSIASGALPMLSSALLATWAVGQGNTMTVSNYYAAGGVASAVDELAEGVFHALDSDQQAAAQTLFLRLIRLADEIPLRLSMSVGDLDASGRAVVDSFVDARMLTLTDGSVRISHDALLDHWGRLKAWIDQGKTDLDALSRIRRATQLWIETGKDAASLIPVQRLEVFAGWIDDPRKRPLLSPEESDFLQASADHFASVLAVERQTNRRLQRQRGGLIGLVSLVSALALVVGIFFVQSQRNAEEARTQRNLAQSRQVSMAAGTIRAQDANLQAQMGAVASELGDTQEGLSALMDATSIDVPTRWLGAATSSLGASPDGAVVVRANGDGRATIWRADELNTSAGTSFTVADKQSPIYSVSVTQQSGHYLAAFGGPETRSLWDVTDEPRLIQELPGSDSTTYAARFEPGGSRVAFGTSDGEVQIFDIADPRAPLAVTVLRLDADREGARPTVSSLAWGTDGLLIVGGGPSSLARWRLGPTPKRLPDLPTLLSGLPMRVLGVALNGSHLVAGLRGSGMLRWTVSGDQATQLTPVTAFTSWVNDVAFAADGTTILAGSSDQSTRLLDSASGQVLRTLTGPSIVTGVAIVDGQPVSASTDGALRVWPRTSPILKAGPSPVYNVGSDASSIWLAAGTGGDGIALWRLKTQERVAVPGPTLGSGDTQAGAVTLAPNGRFMLGGTRGGAVLSWVLDGKGAAFVDRVGKLDGTAAYISVTPDSRVAAAIAYNGTTTGVYRVGDGGHLKQLATLTTPNPQMVGFSRDGNAMSVALADNRVQLYNVSDPAQPRLVSTLTGFVTAPISLAFSPATDRLAVGEDSGQVSIWDTTDVANPKKLNDLGDAHASAYGVAFSPDGRRLAAATADNLVWGWQLGDAPATLWALSAEVGRPWDVRFINDGRGLVVAGDDGHVRTWIVDRPAAVRQVCDRRGTPLTAAEWSRYLPGIPSSDPC